MKENDFNQTFISKYNTSRKPEYVLRNIFYWYCIKKNRMETNSWLQAIFRVL